MNELHPVFDFLSSIIMSTQHLGKGWSRVKAWRKSPASVFFMLYDLHLLFFYQDISLHSSDSVDSSALLKINMAHFKPHHPYHLQLTLQSIVC